MTLISRKRTVLLCCSWALIMGPHKRGPWSQAEDAHLLHLVQSQGAHNWVRISHLLGTRSPKQCRERFHQNLKPSLNHDPITPEEGEVIERLVGEMGKRWAEIARRLRGRSDNAVKNWWNGGMNRRRRIIVRREGQDHRPQELDEKVEALSFARPISSLPRCSGPIQIPPNHQAIERPMISPATSEGSAADSLGDAPSLVSDSSSIISASPNTIKLAHPLLPPPITPVSDGSRQQPPVPRFQNGEPAFEPQYASTTYFEPHRSIPVHAQQRLYQFADITLANSAPVFTPRQISESPPQRQYQLPPFQTFVRSVEKPDSPAGRSRMSVSAMLD
ncbi:MAG: hypothetical protein LQ350_007733 [Teloschistes chrysophthalmus]|nr:MAG: hypothetical protein LQ350_007733 [Niorma chrysophthalma]